MTLRHSPTLPPPPLAGRPAAPKKRRGRGLRARLATVSDLTRHFTGTKRLFLLPMIIVLLLAAVALIVVQIIEYAAPFVYSIF